MIDLTNITLIVCVALVLSWDLERPYSRIASEQLRGYASCIVAQSHEPGLTPYEIASIILAASISQTFFDAFPAIFLARRLETALTVLPAEAYAEGRGIERFACLPWEVLARSFLPSFCRTLSWVVSNYYDYLTKYVGVLLSQSL